MVILVDPSNDMPSIDINRLTKQVDQPTCPPLTGVILAGGRATRMGGRDKGLLEYQGKPLIEHALERLAPQVDELLINANRHMDVYQQYTYPVIKDTLADYPGPLAGILAGLQRAKHDVVLCIPCDTPHYPRDLAQPLYQTLIETQKNIAVAHDGERLQPLHLMLHRDCAQSIQRFLQSGERAVRVWLEREMAGTCVLQAVPPDSFTNINGPDDLAQAAVSTGG